LRIINIELSLKKFSIIIRMRAEGCESNNNSTPVTSDVHSIVEVYTSQEGYSEEGVPPL